MARSTGYWGQLDVYSDGGADGAGSEYATAEYGWLVGGTAESLEIWARGGATVRGPVEDMDSNRAELYGAIACLKKVSSWEGKIRLYTDNMNVRRAIRRMQCTRLAEDMWDAGEWDGACDQDLLETLARLVRWHGDRLGAHWQPSHMDDEVADHDLLTKHEQGNVAADWICNEVKRYLHRGYINTGEARRRLCLPRGRSWHLTWRGTEIVGPPRRQLTECIKAERIAEYFKVHLQWALLAQSWIGLPTMRDWLSPASTVGGRVKAAKLMGSMWETADVRLRRGVGDGKCALCGLDARTDFRCWHLLGRCRHREVVAVRRQLLKKLTRIVQKTARENELDEEVVDAILMPWRIDEYSGRVWQLSSRDEALAVCKRSHSTRVKQMWRVVWGERPLVTVTVSQKSAQHTGVADSPVYADTRVYCQIGRHTPPHSLVDSKLPNRSFVR